MATTTILFIFFFIFQFKKTNTSNPNSVVQTTCKSTPYPELCVSQLTSRKPSPTTDVRGLALITVDIIKSQLQKTMAEIEKMKGEAESLVIRKALDGCSKGYSEALKWFIPETNQALENGDPKFAVDGAVSVGEEADNCDGYIIVGSTGMENLYVFDKFIRELCLVSAAISKQLL